MAREAMTIATARTFRSGKVALQNLSDAQWPKAHLALQLLCEAGVEQPEESKPGG